MVRFTERSKQVNQQFAIDLIAAVPPKVCTSSIVACDGGGGALGHPKVYINLVSRGPQWEGSFLILCDGFSKVLNSVRVEMCTCGCARAPLNVGKHTQRCMIRGKRETMPPLRMFVRL